MLGRGHQGVGIVDDHDAAPPFERPVPGPLDNVPDLLDLDRAGIPGFNDDHVRVHAPGDTPARRADTAGLPLEAVGAIAGRGS